MSAKLWDGSDGERPALCLDGADIQTLLAALWEYQPPATAGGDTYPTAEAKGELGKLLTKWFEAQDRWEFPGPDANLPDTPF